MAIQNDQVYNAALSGSFSGMVYGNRSPVSGDQADYAAEAAVAVAFAAAVDVAWASPVGISDAEEDMLQSACEQFWGSRWTRDPNMAPLAPYISAIIAGVRKAAVGLQPGDAATTLDGDVTGPSNANVSERTSAAQFKVGGDILFDAVGGPRYITAGPAQSGNGDPLVVEGAFGALGTGVLPGGSGGPISIIGGNGGADGGAGGGDGGSVAVMPGSGGGNPTASLCGSDGSIIVGAGGLEATPRLILNGPTSAGATAGDAGALPALPKGYLQVEIAGVQYKLPYYNV